MALDKLNFWRDYYEAGRELTKRDRMELWDALLAYAFAGAEPSLKGAPKAVFIALRARVDGSIQGAENGKRRAAPSKAPSGYPSKAPSKGASQGACEGASQAPPEGDGQDPSGHPSEGPGEGQPANNSQPLGTVQEYRSTGVQEGECRGVTPGDAPRAPEGSQGAEWDPSVNPPGPSEAAAYFEANCLKGDPERFVNVYAAQGWKRGNGRPIEDWRAQARLWSADQPKFDQIEADRAARSKGEAPAGERWAPAKTARDRLAELDAEAERLGIG